jgi:hypothetical protein
MEEWRQTYASTHTKYSISRLSRFTLRERTQYPLERRLCRPRNSLNAAVETRKIFFNSGN